MNAKRASQLVAVVTMWFVVATAIPAFAQVDFSGGWGARLHEDNLERGGGPEMNEFEGLPINAADRMRGDSWSASLWTVPEHQCIPHPADYGPNFSQLVMWSDVDPVTKDVIAWHTELSWMNPVRTIWMDGRPHPPAWAPHTWQGFSTGKWEGDMLTITTTHLKAGWIRRNGVMRSDRAVVNEHIIRHGDHLTWMVVINDPVYLTEPFVRTTDFNIVLQQNIAPYPCESVVEVDRPLGLVPHHLPGTNAFLNEFAEKHKLPAQATRGGAETMYPEYKTKVAAMAAAK